MQLPKSAKEAARDATYSLQQVLRQPLKYIMRHTGRIPLLLILLWVWTLYWGEYLIFQNSAKDCAWHQWESWPADAAPHRVLLVADPQLVDPHTYPGRPWPLSSLTVWITDLYLRRTYNALLRHLRPETTMFLGDLFDGGREWATSDYKSPEPLYRGIGNDFWLKEYRRFMEIFVESWHRHHLEYIPSNEGRRLITSLPGNHDLGFAGGIDLHVKSRFDAHFGPLNRIDTIGNHTFVSIDSVSLSAMNQADSSTGSSGTGDGTGAVTKHMEIWKPVEEFLRNAKDGRVKAAGRRYQELQQASPGADKVTAKVPSALFPTILLTHVPLYRGPEVSCGPMREHGSGISFTGGYQYQNTLTPLISSDIIKHLDAEQLTMIYSGDDHDYCEIEHNEFTGRVREITVKSISMAMGVSRPGVQLASLWNPIELEEAMKDSPSTATPKDTVQNRLCLFPFQAGIFLTYARTLLLTIVILGARAFRYKLEASSHEKIEPLLPLSDPDSSLKHVPSPTHSNTSTTSSVSARSRGGIGSGKSLSGYGNFLNNDAKSELIETEAKDWSDMSGTKNKNYATYRSLSHRSQTPTSLVQVASQAYLFLVFPRPHRRAEFLRSLVLVTLPALAFYFVMLWDEHRRHTFNHER